MKKTLLLIIFLLSACSMVEKPKVDLKNVRFAGLDDKGVSIDFLLSVTNPNSFDLSLDEYRYDLHLMALPLIHGSSKQQNRFPSHTSIDMVIPIRVAYNDVLEILKRRPGLETVPYQLNADLLVGTPIGSINVPVNKNGTITIPEKYRPATVLRKLNGILRDHLQ